MVSHTICELGAPSFWLLQCVCELTTHPRGIPRALCDIIYIRISVAPTQPGGTIWPRRFCPDAAIDHTRLVVTISQHVTHHTFIPNANNTPSS